MEHLLSFRIKHAILKRTAHFTKLFACGLCERVSYSAAWIVFCYNLAQLYLTAKGAKSSSVFRHICDVIPYAGTVYLLCDVVCICPSRSFLSLSSSATRLFFFLYMCNVLFYFESTDSFGKDSALKVSSCMDLTGQLSRSKPGDNSVYLQGDMFMKTYGKGQLPFQRRQKFCMFIRALESFPFTIFLYILSES